MLKRAVLSIAVVLSLQAFAAANVIVGYGFSGQNASGTQAFGSTNAFTVAFTTGSVSQVLTNVQTYLKGVTGQATVSFFNATAAGLPVGSLLSTSTVTLDSVIAPVRQYTFAGFASTTFQANSRYVAVFNGAGLAIMQGASGAPVSAAGTITSYHTGIPAASPFLFSSTPVVPLAFQINGSNVSPPVVPEPSSLALLGVLSLAGLGVKRLRGCRSQAVADAHVAV